MSALLNALLPALAQVERDGGSVLTPGTPGEYSGTVRKRNWRQDPTNRAIENARKRMLAATRKARKARTHRGPHD